MESTRDHRGPLFSAVSESARQLFQLLRCINFSSKVQVQISADGIRFIMEEARVMQGVAFLEKSLFTTYTFNPISRPSQPNNTDDQAPDDDDEDEAPPFQISLSALLEVLQIFGINENKDRWQHGGQDSFHQNPTGGLYARSGNAATAFENRAYSARGICRISYVAPGEPLSIVLEDAGVTTTCSLNTYEPDYLEEIPLQKDAIAQKIIMRAGWLHDAISELSSTSPTKLTITSSPEAPYFVLSSSGPLGSTEVQFAKDPQLLETFQVAERTVNSYKFSMVKAASRAMELATKVSIRTDGQGVLSLQFMIEVDTGGFSFVDFRFVPFALVEAGEGIGGTDDEMDDG